VTVRDRRAIDYVTTFAEPRRLLRADGATPCLDELDETVGGVERELHRAPR